MTWLRSALTLCPFQNSMPWKRSMHELGILHDVVEQYVIFGRPQPNVGNLLHFVQKVNCDETWEDMLGKARSHPTIPLVNESITHCISPHINFFFWCFQEQIVDNNTIMQINITKLIYDQKIGNDQVQHIVIVNIQNETFASRPFSTQIWDEKLEIQKKKQEFP